MRSMTLAILFIFTNFLFAQDRPRTEVTVVQQAVMPSILSFDVRYHDDRGKLVLAEKGLRFEDISDAKHSHSWSYAQIKELKRDGKNEIKLEPYSGDSMEF